MFASTEVFSTFDQTGGRIGSGVRGSGQGGVGRCRG
ncbi:sulfate adenylyltransferase [Streptomyces daliensis]|uniref:Sulfate adenylyltransferase n=1 Tax=Streptomyces daliensis TaxID=299421 RepID=A0A8T4IZ35_9ACTN|nr:sulfate adenylyltransferase [Streptomyces daliensis]